MHDRSSSCAQEHMPASYPRRVDRTAALLKQAEHPVHGFQVAEDMIRKISPILVADHLEYDRTRHDEHDDGKQGQQHPGPEIFARYIHGPFSFCDQNIAAPERWQTLLRSGDPGKPHRGQTRFCLPE